MNCSIMPTTMKAQGKRSLSILNLRPVLWKSEAEMVEKLNRLAFRADWSSAGVKKAILTGENTPERDCRFLPE